MQKLKIDYGSCVRASSKYSECTKCYDICPIENKGIAFDENIVKITDSCIDCGGCIGVCPSEAISLSDFNTTEFVFKFLESDEDTIREAQDLPTLATLSVEHLISLAILSKNDLILDISKCAEGETANLLESYILPTINEANLFLKSIGVDKEIEVVRLEEDQTAKQIVDEEEPNRRDFLKRLSPKGIIKSKVEFDKEIEKVDRRELIDSTVTSSMRDKSYPDKRKLLFMALKRVEKAQDLNKVSADTFSFISQKSIDSSCDNCSFCYRLCPTGALSSDQRGSKIDFDPLSCIKCHLCHDVCQSSSIHLTDFDLVNIFEAKMQRLIEFKQRRCAECGNFYTLLPTSNDICPRCNIEEEEAKSLWGIR
jgi:ferredoxin